VAPSDEGAGFLRSKKTEGEKLNIGAKKKPVGIGRRGRRPLQRKRDFTVGRGLAPAEKDYDKI